jgi:hypothetical protein
MHPVEARGRSDLAQLGVLEDRFVVEFRPHLTLVAVDNFPVEHQTVDLVDPAGFAMPDACGAVAIGFHR